MSRYRRGVSRRYLRAGALIGHVLVLAAVLTCLRLGWWQWKVFEAARGTVQNLGYALLWPVFAGSFIYMWLRFLQLEEMRQNPAEGGADAVDAVDPDGADAPGDAAPGPDPDPADRQEPDEVGGGRNLRHTRNPAPEREVYTVGVGYIGIDDDDDPELAAYNRALAELADEDNRRAR